MTAATPPYRWCVLYADTADRSAVLALMSAFLGPPDHLDVIRIPGFTVDIRPNPDHTGGDHHLDWSTTLEIDADDEVADRSVTAFVTSVIDHLRAAGLRVGAECEFPSALPPPDTRQG